jgi:two-component system, OmpR family, heavy metal sensor histidine kinase CusS
MWRPKKFRCWSLTAQLALIYTLSIFGILILTVLSIYWIFTTRLEHENMQFLQNKIFVLQKLLHTNPTTIANLTEEVVIEPPIYHYYSRVLDANGRIIIETPGMRRVAPQSIFLQNPETGGSMQVHYWRPHKDKVDHQKHFLLVNAESKTNFHRESTLFIQIAMDISGQREMVESYQRDMGIVLLMGILSSAAIVILVTKKGLRPLTAITQSTQRISIAQLQERLNPADWPRELTHLAMAFNLMMDRIEEGFTRLSQFSGDLAHELRTPITNLQGEAEVALSRPRTKEEYRRVLESSLEEFERLSRLIKNLLFLARAENPQMVIHAATIEIEDLFQDIRDFYSVSAEEKGVTICCNSQELSLRADRQLIGQALSNLVANALRHTLPGGTITLAAQCIGHQYIQLSVSDTGEGIPTEHLPRLFDRFYRVDSARSLQTGGTGLGLSIVKSIMDLHKGQVTLTSELGQGTTVRLLFPLNFYE